MSDYHEDFPQPDDPELLASLTFADQCESIAQQHDERYKNHLSDVCGKIGLSGNLGIQTRANLGFKAERIRECDDRGNFGDVLEAEYEISRTVEQYEFSGLDMPAAIQAEIIRRKLCQPEDIYEPRQIFMLGYYLGIDVTSEGNQSSELNVYVGNGQRMAYLNQKLVRRVISAVMRDASRDATEFSEVGEKDDLLDSLFSTEEMAEFEDLLIGLDARERNKSAIHDFFTEVGVLAERLKKAPHALGLEMLDELFTPKQAH